MRHLFILGLTFTVGCSTAKVAYFPKSSAEINFDNISTVNDKKTAFWTNETISEFYIQLPKTNDSLFFKAVGSSFRRNGYKKGILDLTNQIFSAERGVRPNEWATLTRVYYKINDANIQLYVQSQIAQDGTGGWRENRAKKIAMGVFDFLKNNKN